VFSISPLGQTPRSARSDKNIKSIENDDIDEEIEEDLSIGEDLLKSDRSLVSDISLTSVHSVKHASRFLIFKTVYHTDVQLQTLKTCDMSYGLAVFFLFIPCVFEDDETKASFAF
jgi:hypothetical protein